MIQRGYGMEFSHNLEVVAHRLQLASEAVRKTASVALTEVGVYLLGEAHRDYRSRSKGQTDKAGNSWPGITRSAIISRFHRKPNSPYMKLHTEVVTLRKQEAPLMEKLRRKLPKGKSAKKRKSRRRIAAEWLEKDPDGQAAAKLRKTINQKRSRKKSLVDRDHSKAVIGVDTGRLVNSLDFKKQSDEMILKATATTVTIGSVVIYAKYYDERRPIIASNFMTPARVVRCEGILKKHADKAIKDSLGDAGAQA